MAVLKRAPIDSAVRWGSSYPGPQLSAAVSGGSSMTTHLPSRSSRQSVRGPPTQWKSGLQPPRYLFLLISVSPRHRGVLSSDGPAF